MSQDPPAAPPLPHPTVVAFLEDLGRRDAAANTTASYRRDLAHFAAWFTRTVGEAFAPGSVTPTDLRDYRAHLQTVERRASATINRRLAALRALFRYSVATGQLSEAPTDAVKGVAASPRAPRSLEKRELDKLIRAVERHGSTRDQALVLTLRHTGIRVSELCALTLHDIAVSERSGSLTVRSGKGRKLRVVPLNADVRRALNTYLKKRPVSLSEALFLGQRGGGLKPRAVEHLLTKYAYLAQLPGVTPHTLRHSFGKHLLDLGSDLVTVAALLGHSKLQTVAIYTTPSQRDLEKAVERLSWEGGGL